MGTGHGMGLTMRGYNQTCNTIDNRIATIYRARCRSLPQFTRADLTATTSVTLASASAKHQNTSFETVKFDGQRWLQVYQTTAILPIYHSASTIYRSASPMIMLKPRGHGLWQQ